MSVAPKERTITSMGLADNRIQSAQSFRLVWHAFIRLFDFSFSWETEVTRTGEHWVAVYTFLVILVWDVGSTPGLEATGVILHGAVNS